jgi:hypothetical protein
MYRREWWKICLLPALLLAASRGRAQVVHGQTVLRPNGEPAPGVVVELLDSAGAAPVVRAFSDERGRFLLRDAGRGRFILRAMRIGLRPLHVPIILGAADTSVVLDMVPVPLSLPPVVARDERSCNTRPDSGLALGSLWNDAESALLAASITRSSPDYQFAVVDYTRDFDFTTRELDAVAFKDIRSSGARAWTSVPPSQLRRHGFVVIGRDSATFIAPDIETLVSRDFVESHCFELASHRVASDTSIGIDFTPAGALTHPEVRGTIWLDRATHELRSIEFRYVHLELSDADSAAGGQVRFARLATGGWIVTDWSVQAPVLRIAVEQRVFGGAPVPRGRRAPRAGTTLLMSRGVLMPDRLRVGGSTLREVRGDSGILWSRNPSTLELRITSGAERRPLGANEAMAYLLGSDLRAATDSNGVVSIPNLVDGSYLVEIGTSDLDVLGWARRRVRVDVQPRRSRETVDVQLESPLTAARAVCGDDAKLLGDTMGVIVGSVSNGVTAIAGRTVRLSWSDGRSGSAATRAVSRTTRTMAGDGRFFVCGVPREVPIQISVDSAAASTTTELARGRVVAIVALTVAR